MLLRRSQRNALLVAALIFTAALATGAGCSDQPPAPEQAATEPTAPKSVTAPAPAPRAAEPRQAPGALEAPRVASVVGEVSPLQTAGAPVAEEPVALGAGARLAVDWHGTRYEVWGPALCAFARTPEPVLLMAWGTWSFDRAGAGRRGTAARVALPAGVVRATSAARAVGRWPAGVAGPDGAGASGGRATVHAHTGAAPVVEVVSGSVTFGAPGIAVGAGKRLLLNAGAAQLHPAPHGRLEGRAEILAGAGKPGETDAKQRSDLLQALNRATRAYTALQLVAARAASGTLSGLERQKRLAELAVEQFRARRALRSALDRYRAGHLEPSATGSFGWPAPALGALDVLRED